MPPYWFFSVLALIGLVLFSPKKSGGQASFLESIFLVPSDQPFVLMVGWSLVYEVYFYILFGVCCAWFGRRGALLAACLCAFLPVLYFFSLGKEYVFGVFNLLLPLYFSAGILLGLSKERVGVFLKNIPLLFAVPVFVVAFILFFYLACAVKDGVPRILGYGPLAFLIFIFFWWVGSALPKLGWGGFAAIGEWSYSLYLSHWLVLNFFLVLFAKLKFDYGFVGAVPVVGLCVLFSYLSWRMVEVPLARMGKRFFES